MTPTEGKHFERRAGMRLGFLCRQLIDDGWKAAEISRASGIDPKLISTWLQRVRNPTLPYDTSRNGISDQTIAGIHDGLGVRSDFLFMSAKGYPKTVRLSDGTERPCDPDELDHKLFKVVDIAEAREKRDTRDVAFLMKHAERTDARFERIEKMLEQLVDDSKRNAR